VFLQSIIYPSPRKLITGSKIARSPGFQKMHISEPHGRFHYISETNFRLSRRRGGDRTHTLQLLLQLAAGHDFGSLDRVIEQLSKKTV